MEKVTYLNQPNCYRLSNDEAEAIVTTDVGPRVIRYALRGGENMLGEVPETTVETELGGWKPWGGHRLWAAPEAMPRSYSPDNEPVEFEVQGDSTIRLRQRVEPRTGLRKELTVSLEPAGTRLSVHHRITNESLWPVELAPWAITIMSAGGLAIIPQEPYLSWAECLLPSRPLVLWHYTDLSDTRFRLGPKFIRLRAEEGLASPQKLGVLNKQGWSAYVNDGTLFVKTVPHREGANYPDHGSNNEAYTAGSYMEIETLAHLRRLDPGESAEHVEEWFLFRDFSAGEADEELASAIGPLVKQVLGARGPE